MRRTAGLFLLGLVVGGGLSAVVADMHFSGLKGLQEFKVIVEELDEDGKAGGLSSNRLHTDMVLRLRSHGLKPQKTTDDPLPSLYLNSNAMPLDHTGQDSHYVWTVKCEYNQGVVAPNGELVLARLWFSDASGRFGVVPAERYADKIRGAARDCADDFAAAFLEANPDFTPPRPSD